MQGHISNNGTFHDRHLIARSVIVLTSMGLFGTSLFMPAFSSIGGNVRVEEFGAILLRFGWVGVYSFPPMGFGWLANPVYLVALLLFARYNDRGALRAGVYCCLLAAMSFIPREYWLDLGHKPFQVIFRRGSFLWCAAVATIPLGAWLMMKLERHASRPSIQSF